MANYGMIVFGRSGDWELSIDENLDESDKWQVQIDTAVVSLQYRLSKLTVWRELDRLLSTNESNVREGTYSLRIGAFNDDPVTATLDNECSSRLFITVGDAADARFEVTVAGKDFSDFGNAVSQIVNELDLE